MRSSLPSILGATFLASSPLAGAVDADRDPAWAGAAKQSAMDAAETRAFMRQLAQYVLDHHLKKTAGSPQQGMTYEYFHVTRAGQADQFIQGEGLDTMHDGAWFAVAMVQAFRATGDPFYKEVLTRWQLPFYLRMLNHSDELFVSENNDARAGAAESWFRMSEWLLQKREKGFVPYWWDDGASVSLEMRGRKDGDVSLNFPGHNALAGQPNPEKRLSGYSFGSSNHLAQDLGAMLQQTWLLFRESGDPAEQRLAGEIAEAARHLQECRARHGSANIPAVRAALALSSGDAAMRQALPAETWESIAKGRSDYRRALVDYQPGEQISAPAFADNQEYRYYAGLARDGALTAPLAFALTYDAFTLPMLYRAYSDDSEVPPGINVFDLHPYRFTDGHPLDTRSQRKGPAGRPRPIGSRFGPQNMVVTGWALQALRAQPGLWETAHEKIAAPHFFPAGSEAEVREALTRELAGGLRTWEAIFQAKGYIPTALGAGDCGAGFSWDELSDTGGYAHLIAAGAQWLLCHDGRSDWETQHVPPPR